MSSCNLVSVSTFEKFLNKIPLGETPLWQYWELFQGRYLESGRSSATVHNVRDALKLAISRLNLFTIEQVNNSTLLEDTLFAYKTSEKISNVTYNAYLKNLNTYFRWLEKRGHIPVNNIPRVMRCKEEIKEQQTLSEEEVRRIVGQVHSRRQTRLERLRNVLFIDLLRFTGARPCELLSLRLQDFRERGDAYEIVIRGRKQKGRPRYYRCPSYLRDSFEAYRNYRARLRSNEHMLFISSSKRTGWTDKGMRGLFKRLSKEVGFKVTAYGFRRYVATKLNAVDLPVKHIQQYLGHTRSTTTEKYIERSCVLTDKGAEVMSKV